MDDADDAKQNGYTTPKSSTSSTPSSPLPISVGAGNQKYFFSSSPSPSPSPPFSPPTSPPGSSECLAPLLHETKKVLLSPITAVVPSAFSVDRNRPDESDSNHSSSCLKDWLEWFLQRCCSCIVGNDFLQHRTSATRLPLIRD